ncbi:MAG: hypothetical protein J2P13_01555 [Acidobacteria bacterium]|nr:hypothetical protein [Acidobacteriota bacterium]
MSTVDRIASACKALVFGSADLRQVCALGLSEPQSEVSVWLLGLGAPRDVTHSHIMASARPLVFGIGLVDGIDPAVIERSQVSLEFREQGGKKQLLGRIGLRWKEAVPLSHQQLLLFETTECGNYCLPKPWLWARYAHHAYYSWRANRRLCSSTTPVSVRELHSVYVFYICPRPVALVSVRDENLVNIFPMDLIGPILSQHFSLGLHSTGAAVPLLERSRRIAVSSVPAEQATLAYELGPNHRKSTIDLAQAPFAVSRSAAFGLPVPQFSLRVREMLIEKVRDLGSHKLFLARIVEDQRWVEGPQLFHVHGIYHSRRLRHPVEAAGESQLAFGRDPA